MDGDGAAGRLRTTTFANASVTIRYAATLVRRQPVQGGWRGKGDAEVGVVELAAGPPQRGDEATVEGGRPQLFDQPAQLIRAEPEIGADTVEVFARLRLPDDRAPGGAHLKDNPAMLGPRPSCRSRRSRRRSSSRATTNCSGKPAGRESAASPRLRPRRATRDPPAAGVRVGRTGRWGYGWPRPDGRRCRHATTCRTLQLSARGRRAGRGSLAAPAGHFHRNVRHLQRPCDCLDE